MEHSGGDRDAMRSASPVARTGMLLGILLATTAMTPNAAPLPSASPASSPGQETGRYVLSAKHSARIPAFARKYNLACSACHTVWPELNNFGQVFKDNGYQLLESKDAPITRDPSYFPISFRTTPNYHIETTTNQLVDVGGYGCPSNNPSDCTTKTITQQGFDLSGVDVLMLGTLYKNISFGLVPTLDPVEGSVGIESAFIRFNNIGDNSWFNFKFGKFELDNMLSEKRITTLSNNGGLYQSYHFNPVGDINAFGLGDNQLGMELMGHDKNSYTRYSLAVISTSDGEPGLPTGSGADLVFTLQKAFQTGVNLEKIGLFGVLGQYPTTGPTSGGAPIAGAANGNKSFTRLGLVGSLWMAQAHLELIPLWMYGQDNVALTPSYVGPDGPVTPTQNPAWNAFLLEAHYIVNPQLLFEGRWESVQMSQQADPSQPKNMGNIDAFTLGMRLYAFMFSRDGLALHVEYSNTKTIGAYPLSGDGAPPIYPATGGVMIPLESPNGSTTAITSSSLFLGLDFAF